MQSKPTTISSAKSVQAPDLSIGQHHSEPLPTCMPIGIQRSAITGRFGLWFEGSPECIPAETVLAEYPLTDDQKAQLRAELKEMGWVEY